MRRILGVLNLTKKYGVASTDEACALGLGNRCDHYHFVRRYSPRRQPATAAESAPGRSADRQLTLYRDLIESRTQNLKQENPA